MTRHPTHLVVATLALAAALAVTGCPKEAPEGPRFCEPPTPPAEALRKAGPYGDGRILPGGRLITPAGQTTELGGFPMDLVLHPVRPLAYVSKNGWGDKALQVVRLDTGDIVQELDHEATFHGMAITADGTRLYVSGGESGLVDVYDLTADGTAVPTAAIPIAGYPAGMALSEDGATLWVASFSGKALTEVDTRTNTVLSELPLGIRGYGVVYLPGRQELWVTGFHDYEVAVVDLAAWAVSATVEVGKNPLGIVATSDESRVFVAVTDDDLVVAVDVASRAVVASEPVGEASIADTEGVRLPGSSPTRLALDASGSRLYVTRSADNALSVLDPQDLSPLGAIPVGWYPTAVTVAPDGRLVVTNGKGVSTGPVPLGTGKRAMIGTLSVIDPAEVDLAESTLQVEENVRLPSEVWTWDCADAYPAPARAGAETPIEHIVLIVRENKTYDAVLGDLEGADGDPSLVRWGEEVTPNLHALARRFTGHDNFYDDSENSVQGHLWLTGSFVNDYIERINLADFPAESVADQGQPRFGSWFTHLLTHGVSFVNFGEIVGTFGSAAGQTVIDHTDLDFPGVFFNLDVKDQEKAEYVAQKLVDEGQFPTFVFVGIPNDHTYGTDPGALTPEAMISDNDYATGLLVDRISHSPYWEKTAIFILEDDPQSGGDHVDYHRSLLIVASPWAKRGHTSSVHTSIPSLFRTFELILGIPPMNRFDALATPLWDAFSPVPDLTPYDTLPRTVPDEYNPENAPGAAFARRMDFSGPDRNPDLGDLLWWHHFGAPPPGSRLARALARGETTLPEDPDDDEDGDRDTYDQHWRRFYAWLRANPQVRARLRPSRHPPLGRRRAP